MSDKQYPSNLYLESAATNVDFAKQVSVEAVVVMAKELLALRNQPVSQHYKLTEGWKLVPVEPTKEMRLASRRYVAKTKLTSGPGFYRAMVAAAPTPSQ